MTKLSRKYLDTDKLGLYVNNLWSAFTLVDSKEDVKLLFRDLFTHTEYKMLAKRLEIARRVLNGQGYDQIIKQLSVTERTIANINNILAEKGDGFRNAHAKLEAIEQKHRNREVEKINRMSSAFRHNPGEKVLGEALVETFKFAGRKIGKYRKAKSARERLPV